MGERRFPGEEAEVFEGERGALWERRLCTPEGWRVRGGRKEEAVEMLEETW